MKKREVPYVLRSSVCLQPDLSDVAELSNEEDNSGKQMEDLLCCKDRFSDTRMIECTPCKR